MDMTQEEMLNEFLSIRPDSEEILELEKSIAKEITPELVIDVHKRDIQLLKQIQLDMKRTGSAYSRGEVKREEIEPLYLAAIDTYFRMARRFHPLSTYGKGLLERAISCRKEFESLVGVLVSSVTAENVELFSALLTKDLQEEIRMGKYKAIGAIRCGVDGIYGVGALVYYLDNRPVDYEPVLRIKWLFVDEEWRSRGVGNFLIGEMVGVMAEYGIEGATVDFSIEGDTTLLGELLNQWFFKFVTGVSPEFICCLEDVENIDKLEEEKSGTTVFSDLGEEEALDAIKKNFKDNNYQGYLTKLESEADFYEFDLSCFTGQRQRIRSMMLAHRYPSGLLSVEYFSFEESGEKDFPKLTATFVSNAYKKYPRYTSVFMPVDSIVFGEYLEEMFPVQQGLLLAEGLLIPPTEELDIYKEDIEQMMQMMN